MIDRVSGGKGFWAWLVAIFLGNREYESYRGWICLRARFRPSMDKPYGNCYYRFWVHGKHLKPWWEV